MQLKLHHLDQLVYEQLLIDQLIDFTSGYFQRGLNQMPKQGNKAPWKNYQNYLKDIFAVRLMSIDDTNLKFSKLKD